jgi:hypothetical protein
LGDFPLGDGSMLKNAKISEIKDDGVQIVHNDGDGFFEYSLLPESVRVKALHEETLLTLDKMRLK